MAMSFEITKLQRHLTKNLDAEPPTYYVRPIDACPHILQRAFSRYAPSI